MAYTFFALANTKNIAVFVDPGIAEVKLADKIKDLGIEAIIVSDDYLPRMKEFIKNFRLSIPIIQCESRRWGEYDTTYRLPTSMSASDSDVVALFETAGTAGKSKMVPFTHTMLQHACLVLRSIYRTSPIDQFFTFNNSLAKPFYFVHGLIFPLISGCGVVITDLIAPEELGKELLEGKVSRVIMKSSLIEDWLTSFKNINIKLPFLKSITREQGPLDKRVDDLVTKEFNVKIINIYGSVETCWAVAGRQFEEPEDFESVGKFLSGVKTRVVDENGDDVPTNKTQRGQLLVSGPGVATGYINNKEATKLNMRGSWFFTEDYVEVDKKDVVRFLDRKDNICKVVTNYLAPRDIEKKLADCPGVNSVAILNLKDQLGKPALTAIISKKTGFELSAAEFQEFCRNKLAEHERPKNVAFIDEMPLDSYGDINKYKLRFDFGS